MNGYGRRKLVSYASTNIGWMIKGLQCSNLHTPTCNALLHANREAQGELLYDKARLAPKAGLHTSSWSVCGDGNNKGREMLGNCLSLRIQHEKREGGSLGMAALPHLEGRGVLICGDLNHGDEE